MLANDVNPGQVFLPANVSGCLSVEVRADITTLLANAVQVRVRVEVNAGNLRQPILRAGGSRRKSDIRRLDFCEG